MMPAVSRPEATPEKLNGTLLVVELEPPSRPLRALPNELIDTWDSSFPHLKYRQVWWGSLEPEGLGGGVHRYTLNRLMFFFKCRGSDATTEAMKMFALLSAFHQTVKAERPR
jgi:hypothetical protein